MNIDLMDTTPVVVLLICIYYFDLVIRCGPYPQVQVWLLKKNQVKSPGIWSRVSETDSDLPIGSDRDSGCDRHCFVVCPCSLQTWQ